MKKQDVISGALLVALSALLYTQTSTPSSDMMFEDDIDPMKYPRMLVYLLGVLGLMLAGKGLILKEVVSEIPIFSRRTVGIIAVLLIYAGIFTTVGFFVSSLLASFAVAFIMGWRRLFVLAASCVMAVVVIWLLFTYILRIPLPVGTLF